MTRTLQSIEQALDASIPNESVKEREGGGGKSLSYLEGHYVIGQLNKVFGPLGWATQTTKLDKVFEGEVENRYGKKGFHVSYIAQVRLVVEGAEGTKTEHTATGYGDGQDSMNPGKAHELAVKEAETDALKRCAKNLGNSMGLELYNKDKNAAREEAKEEAKQQPKPKVKAAVNNEELPKVLALISSTARALVGQARGYTLEGIKNDMTARYSVYNKDDLNIDQAKEFCNYLLKTVNSKNNQETA